MLALFYTSPPRDATTGGQAVPPPTRPAPGLSLAAELKRRGLTALCSIYVLDFAPENKPCDARDTFLRWLTARDETPTEEPRGSQFIEGHADRVEEFYKRGVRHLQLVHERDDLVAPLGDTNTAAAHLGGLTPIGAECCPAKSPTWVDAQLTRQFPIGPTELASSRKASRGGFQASFTDARLT